jgi:hypothetical protein
MQQKVEVYQFHGLRDLEKKKLFERAQGSEVEQVGRYM